MAKEFYTGAEALAIIEQMEHDPELAAAVAAGAEVTVEVIPAEDFLTVEEALAEMDRILGE